MKRLFALILCLAALLSLCSCGSVLDSDLKTFTKGELTIKLPEAFEEEDKYDACFRSGNVYVWAIKDHFAGFDGSSEWTLEEYANAIYIANESKFPTSVECDGKIANIEYTVYNETKKMSFTYFTAMYKSTDAFWMIQFVCEESEYSMYEPHFREWAKTVKFSQET